MEFNRKWIVNTVLLVCSFQYPCYASMKSHDGVYNNTIIRQFESITKESITDGLPYNICYCIGSKCLYCPIGTYCTDDRSGCCLEPHCHTKDGKYCACLDKARNDNNYEVEHSINYETSSNRHSGQTNDPLTLNQDDIGYFTDICKKFADGTRQQNPNPNIVQFAAMTLNKASDDSSSSNKYDPYPTVFVLNQQLHNYDSAPPLKQGSTILHAEMRVLDYSNVETMLKWFKLNRKQSQPQPPSVYPFSYLSPCGNCLNSIADLKSKHDISRVYVAWHLAYDGMKQNMFLQGLETFYKKGVTVVYNIKGLCFDPKRRKSPPLVQPTLFNALFQTYRAKFCKTNKELRKSLAKLVNHLVWECKNVFDIDSESTTEKNVVFCFQDEINKCNPKIDPEMELQSEVKQAVDGIWNRNKKLLMSPPLSPNDPTAISNDINDLRGKIGNPLCFQKIESSTHKLI